MAVDQNRNIKIALMYIGKQAPGGNNLIDGLLRFAKQRGNVELFGFRDGVDGISKETIFPIEEKTFKSYRNLGGYDYLGRSTDNFKTVELQA